MITELFSILKNKAFQLMILMFILLLLDLKHNNFIFVVCFVNICLIKNKLLGHEQI